MIAEHSDAVEADLARYYQLDFADHYRGRLSLRRLRSLIGWLPPDSAVAQVEEVDRQQWEARKQVSDIEDVLARFRA